MDHEGVATRGGTRKERTEKQFAANYSMYVHRPDGAEPESPAVARGETKWGKHASHVHMLGINAEAADLSCLPSSVGATPTSCDVSRIVYEVTHCNVRPYLTCQHFVAMFR